MQEAEQRQRIGVFAPAFSKLVEVLRGHCRYPQNWRSLDRAERSEFKRSRSAIGDTLTDVAGTFVCLCICSLIALGTGQRCEGPSLNMIRKA